MKKKLLSVLMAAVMVAGVGGVGAAQVKADDEKILGAGIYSASDNFNSYIGKAITNACDGIFKTNIEDGQNDQSTQNNQVDTMLAKGASVVAVSVCDVTAAPTLIQKCKDAGNVPIIFFNKEITDYDVINSYENAYQVTSTGGDYGASIQAQMVIDYWKEHPEMEFYPRTFIFGAKAAAGYKNAKLTIKLINSVADVINNDPSINGKIKVVFIEDYRVSNAELIFAAADVSEQISTASKEASGTGNMKFMLNGALTLGTMDGANVEIVEEVGKENAFIFGLSADQVMEYEKNGNYNPRDVYNNNQDVRQVLTQLVNGFYSPENPELFRALYDALLEKDTYFTLLDFDSYKEAHNRIDAAYRDEEHWARTAMLQTASAGKFSSDRTIEEYAKEMWHLEKVTL